MSFSRLQKLLLDLGEEQSARRIRGVAENATADYLRVVVFGDFNRGKSTLINALVGRPILQAKLVPTTGHVTQVVQGKPDQLFILFRDGRTEATSLSRHNEISTLDSNGQVREDVELLTVAIDSPLLARGLALVDTPGRNEAASQSDRTAIALMSADVVLWLLDARQCLHQIEREMTLAWLNDRPGIPLLPIVNFMNLMDEEEDRADVRRRLDTWGNEGLQELTTLARSAVRKCYFEVNARGALLSTTASDPAPDDDFPTLVSQLQLLAGPAGHEVRRRSRIAQARAFLGPILATNNENLLNIQRALDSTASERESRRHELRHQRNALQANCQSQKAAVASGAATVLAEKLNAFRRKFESETKPARKHQADDWYAGFLTEAVAEIESQADRALATLARSAGLSALPAMMLASRVPLTIAFDGTTDDDDEDEVEEAEEKQPEELSRQDRRAARRADRVERRADRVERRTERREACSRRRARLDLENFLPHWSSAQQAVVAELSRQFDAGLRTLEGHFDGRLSVIDAEKDEPGLMKELAARKEIDGLIHDLLTQSQL